MLIVDDLVKVEWKAAEALRRILEELPSIEHLDVKMMSQETDPLIDLCAKLKSHGQEFTLIAKVQTDGDARQVRPTLVKLQEVASQLEPGVIPVLIAPHLTAQSQELCREYKMGYIDLYGNARLSFGTFFLSHKLVFKASTEQKETRSLFRPKSAQMLRRMLRDPAFSWRLAELARVSGISLGYVSSVRAALLELDWAKLSEQGMYLSDPNAMLETWVKVYESPVGRRLGFHTALSGDALMEAVRAFPPSSSENGQVVLASFSAARLLAPKTPTDIQYFYADALGLKRMRSLLDLTQVRRGENVVVTVIDDRGLFLDNMLTPSGLTCTSPVQTYLDLCDAGERGREAADHLRQEKMQWPSETPIP